MNRLIKAACFVMVLLAITIVSYPIKSLNILASGAKLKSVNVSDNNLLTQYNTNAKTVESFFKEQGIKLGSKDQCDYLSSENITDGMVIHIKRAMNITVSIDGANERRRISPGTTIERLMTVLQAEYDLSLLFNDNTAREIQDGETLSFTSWRSLIYSYPQVIPFETASIETTAVREGTTRVRQEGINGKKMVTVAVIYIGDKESQREVLDEVIVSEPVTQIVDIGIGGTLGTTTDITSPSFQYVQKLTMNASAYYAGYESTGKNPGDPGYGITYSGLPVQRGIVSVDPRVIPLGTRLYVDGYGYSLAADTGSGIVGNKIDLYYETYEDAIRFGRRDLDVYILD